MVGRLRETSMGLTLLFLLLAVLSSDGWLNGGKPITFTLVSIILAFLMFCLTIYFNAYEEWQIAEEERIRNYFNRYGNHGNVRSCFRR